MQRFQHYIDGVFEDGAASFKSLDPATGTAWALMPDAGPADVDRAVQAAWRAFRGKAWAGLTASARGKLLYKLADLVQADTGHGDQPRRTARPCGSKGM